MEKKLYLRELISVTEKEEEEEEFSFIQIIPAETHRGPLIPIETNCYFVKLDRKEREGGSSIISTRWISMFVLSRPA